MKKTKRIIFLVANLVLPLVVGSIIYYIVSPNTLFVVRVDQILFDGRHLITFDLSNSVFRFCRNYLLDMLWSYALVYALYLAHNNNTVRLLRVFLIAFGFSTVMEFLQLTSLAKGTFDIIDIIVEFLAELIAVFIIKKTHEEERKRYEKVF